MKKELENYKLCFVKNNCAYFTENFEKQWGDDWDDAPYEHNAGTPYEYDYDAPEQGVENGCGIYPKINIKKVYFEIPYSYNLPCTGYLNSPYSVDDINKRKSVAWIHCNKFTIHAETSLKDFINIIKENDGKIYLEY